jgi:hypothetical protein
MLHTIVVKPSRLFILSAERSRDDRGGQTLQMLQRTAAARTSGQRSRAATA